MGTVVLEPAVTGDPAAHCIILSWKHPVCPVGSTPFGINIEELPLFSTLLFCVSVVGNTLAYIDNNDVELCTGKESQGLFDTRFVINRLVICRKSPSTALFLEEDDCDIRLDTSLTAMSEKDASKGCLKVAAEVIIELNDVIMDET